MFAVVLTYTAPLTEVDAALADHVAWLEKQYEDGVLLASGPRNPRTGGVLLVRRTDRARLDELLATDPFAMRGLADYEVVEFYATKTAAELDAVREEI